MIRRGGACKCALCEVLAPLVSLCRVGPYCGNSKAAVGLLCGACCNSLWLLGGGAGVLEWHCRVLGWRVRVLD